MKIKLLVLLFIYSCSSIKNRNVDGVYVMKDAAIKIRIVLKNGLFQYKSSPLTITMRSKGTYKVENNFLYLYSSKDYITAVDTLIVKETRSKKERIIHGVYNYDTNKYLSEIFINSDTTKYYFNNKGIIKIDKELKIDSIIVDDFLRMKYYPKCKTDCNYYIKLNFGDHTKTYFKKEKFIIKKNKIIDEFGDIYHKIH